MRRLARAITRARAGSGLLLMLAAGAFGIAPAAQARVVREPNGQMAGVTLTPRGSLPPIGGLLQGRAARRGAILTYHGGQVLHSSAPYLMFWDPTNSIPASSRSLMTQYFTDVAQASGRRNSVYAVGRQYTDATGYADYQQSFVPSTQVIIDRHAYPDSGNCSTKPPGITTCLTDNQVESELRTQVSVLGLPVGTGADAPIYFIVLPKYVDECLPGTGCASSDFCGYHSYTAQRQQNILYAVIPMIAVTPAENPKLCQYDGSNVMQEPNHDLADLMIPTLSHEDNETITDPLFDAWYASNDNEDGDMCAHTGRYDPLGTYDPNAFSPVLGGSTSLGNVYNQVVNHDHYYVQSEWSNAAQGCAMRPSTSGLLARFKATVGSDGMTVSVDPSGSESLAGFSSVTWNFGDGAIDFSVGSVPASTWHPFQAPGTYRVSLTAVDRLGNLVRAQAMVTVGPGDASSSPIKASSPNPGTAGRRAHHHTHHSRHRARHHRHRHRGIHRRHRGARRQGVRLSRGLPPRPF